MTTHQFSLVTEGTAALGHDDLVRRLAAAGYPDAGLRRPTGGDWVIDVCVEAEAFGEAVLPAIEAVASTGLAVGHVVVDWGA